MSGLYHLGNARTAEQRARMEDLADEGRCILCDPDPDDVVRGGPIRILRNAYPYDGAAAHLLVTPAAHVTRWEYMGSGWPTVVLETIQRAVRFLGVPDYEVRWRSGDPAATGATIEHFHIHVIGRGPTAVEVGR